MIKFVVFLLSIFTNIYLISARLTVKSLNSSDIMSFPTGDGDVKWDTKLEIASGNSTTLLIPLHNKVGEFDFCDVNTLTKANADAMIHTLLESSGLKPSDKNVEWIGYISRGMLWRRCPTRKIHWQYTQYISYQAQLLGANGIFLDNRVLSNYLLSAWVPPNVDIDQRTVMDLKIKIPIILTSISFNSQVNATKIRDGKALFEIVDFQNTVEHTSYQDWKGAFSVH